MNAWVLIHVWISSTAERADWNAFHVCIRLLKLNFSSQKGFARAQPTRPSLEWFDGCQSNRGPDPVCLPFSSSNPHGNFSALLSFKSVIIITRAYDVENMKHLAPHVGWREIVLQSFRMNFPHVVLSSASRTFFAEDFCRRIQARTMFTCSASLNKQFFQAITQYYSSSEEFFNIFMALHGNFSSHFFSHRSKTLARTQREL